MPNLTVLVYGLEQYEQPLFLACAKLLNAINPTSKSRISDTGMVELFRQLESGTAPIAGTFTSFELQYLLDGVPLGKERWTESVLPGADRNVQLSPDRFIRLEFAYFDDRLPVLSIDT